MSRAAWDGVPEALRRDVHGQRYLIDPETGDTAVRVQLTEDAPPDARRPTLAEVAALLSALTRELS